MEKTKVSHEIIGLEIGRDRIEVSHIQFADDSLFFVQDESHVRSLVRLMKDFSKVSGLKINLEKSALLGINVSQQEVRRVASKIGCSNATWPITYLRVPLGGNPIT